MVYSAAVMRYRKIPLFFDSNDVQIVQIVGNLHAVGEQKNQVGPKARSEKNCLDCSDCWRLYLPNLNPSMLEKVFVKIVGAKESRCTIFLRSFFCA